MNATIDVHQGLHPPSACLHSSRIANSLNSNQISTGLLTCRKSVELRLTRARVSETLVKRSDIVQCYVSFSIVARFVLFEYDLDYGR